MTICLAITSFSPQVGLIATYYDNFSKLLSQYGHRVLILLIDHDSTPTDEDEIREEKNITKIILKKRFHHFRNYYKKYFRPGGFEAQHWIANGFATREWLLKNHKAFDIDIIQTPDYGGLGVFLSDNDLPPLVVFGHGCLTQISRYNYVKDDSHVIILKKLEKLSFEQADAIMTHSPLNKQDLGQLTGRNIEFAIAPWKNDENIFQSSPTSNSIVVAGGLQAVKGAVVMAAAMCISAAKNPALCLNWFGGDTYTAEGNQSMTSFLQKKYPDIWNKNFVWQGKKTRQETKKELAAATFVVIPSLWETFGWTALEAASLGKSIIMTDKTGASYLFTHGYDAWIIPSNNPEKLAEAIELLSNNSELCKKLCNNAKLMVQQVFNEKEIAEERIKLFENIIQNRKPHTNTFEEQITFLIKYITLSRKLYYSLRAFAKKIIGPGKK